MPGVSLSERVPLTRLAGLVGVPEPTVRSWKRHGLATDDRNRASVEELLTFCRTAQHLPAAQRAVPRLAALVRDGLTSTMATEGIKEGNPADGDRPPDDDGGQAARAVGQSARIAAREHLQALLAAARSAEAVARYHREQVEHLAAAYGLLDDTLTNITGPKDLRG